MYRVIKAFEDIMPETPAMIKLSYRLRNYFASFYQIEVIDKYRMYVIPQDPNDNVKVFIDELLDFIDGEIIDIENDGTSWRVQSNDGVRITAGIPGRLDNWCPQNCWMIEIVWYN